MDTFMCIFSNQLTLLGRIFIIMKTEVPNQKRNLPKVVQIIKKARTDL